MQVLVAIIASNQRRNWNASKAPNFFAAGRRALYPWLVLLQHSLVDSHLLQVRMELSKGL